MQIANSKLPVRVTGRHVAITQSIRECAEEKIAHLHLDYPRIIEAHFILDVEKHRHYAELVLHCSNHITIEATSETTDLYASIDEVVAKAAQQMRKYKTRILRQHRPRTEGIRHLQEQVVTTVEFEKEDHAEPEVVTTEKYALKPMYVDEAILQLEMIEKKQFLVFLNASNEKVNVLYRRKDGHFGLIDPILA